MDPGRWETEPHLQDKRSQKVNTSSLLLPQTDEWQMPPGDPGGRGRTGLRWESTAVQMILKYQARKKDKSQMRKASKKAEGPERMVMSNWKSKEVKDRRVARVGDVRLGQCEEACCKLIQSVQELSLQMQRQPGGSFRNLWMQ